MKALKRKMCSNIRFILITVLECLDLIISSFNYKVLTDIFFTKRSRCHKYIVYMALDIWVKFYTKIWFKSLNKCNIWKIVSAWSPITLGALKLNLSNPLRMQTGSYHSKVTICCRNFAGSRSRRQVLRVEFAPTQEDPPRAAKLPDLPLSRRRKPRLQAASSIFLHSFSASTESFTRATSVNQNDWFAGLPKMMHLTPWLNAVII